MMRKDNQPRWRRQYLDPDRYGPMRALIVRLVRVPRNHPTSARLRLVPVGSSPRVLRVLRGGARRGLTGPPYVA